MKMNRVRYTSFVWVVFLFSRSLSSRGELNALSQYFKGFFPFLKGDDWLRLKNKIIAFYEKVRKRQGEEKTIEKEKSDLYVSTGGEETDTRSTGELHCGFCFAS